VSSMKGGESRMSVRIWVMLALSAVLAFAVLHMQRPQDAEAADACCSGNYWPPCYGVMNCIGGTYTQCSVMGEQDQWCVYGHGIHQCADLGGTCSPPIQFCYETPH